MQVNIGWSNYDPNVDAPYTLFIECRGLMHWRCTIDYIWYSHQNLICTVLLNIPQPSEIGGYIPSQFHPSDHLDILAQFRLV